MKDKELREFLEAKTAQYNQSFFIEHDPVQIPHLFRKQEDIEISGFLSAVLAWGQRPTIIRKANELMELMEMSPADFVTNAEDNDLLRFDRFVHRTFNAIDCRYFIRALQHLYHSYGNLGQYFGAQYHNHHDMGRVLTAFKQDFFSLPHEKRTEKHIADPAKGSTAKRLNMFFRWMVRSDDFGVDFGLWDEIPSSALYLPLDLHSARVARKLGLLERKINDWKAVKEVTKNLRNLDPADPVKYDYALFGAGVFEDF